MNLEMKKKEIEIMAYKCMKCGKLHNPFHDRCLECRNREFEPIKPQGNARLRSAASRCPHAVSR